MTRIQKLARDLAFGLLPDFIDSQERTAAKEIAQRLAFCISEEELYHGIEEELEKRLEVANDLFVVELRRSQTLGQLEQRITTIIRHTAILLTSYPTTHTQWTVLKHDGPDEFFSGVVCYVGEGPTTGADAVDPAVSEGEHAPAPCPPAILPESSIPATEFAGELSYF